MPISINFDDCLTIVIQEIGHFTRVPIEQIDENTAVNHDLGVDGADADDLIEHLKNVFKLKEINIDTNIYFGPEIGLGALGMIGAVFSKKNHKVLTVKSITEKIYSHIK